MNDNPIFSKPPLLLWFGIALLVVAIVGGGSYALGITTEKSDSSVCQEDNKPVKRVKVVRVVCEECAKKEGLIASLRSQLEDCKLARLEGKQKRIDAKVAAAKEPGCGEPAEEDTVASAEDQYYADKVEIVCTKTGDCSKCGSKSRRLFGFR